MSDEQEFDGPPADINYEARVGYKQPPKHTRWKKGFCPNPSGRPRKVQTRTHYLESIARRKMPMLDGKRHRTVTLLEAVVLIVKNKAIMGNVTANSIFEKLYGLHLQAIEPGVAKGVFFASEKLSSGEWDAVYNSSITDEEAERDYPHMIPMRRKHQAYTAEIDRQSHEASRGRKT